MHVSAWAEGERECGGWVGVAGVSRAYSMRYMSDDRSRQHGKFKIGQLLKMLCAEWVSLQTSSVCFS